MKTGIGRLTVAAGLLVALAGSAHAGKVLWTPPALAAYPAQQTIYCDIVNVAPTPQDVTIDVLDYYGNVITSSGPQTLAAATGTATGSADFSAARCRFTVSGSTKKVRAMAIYDNGSAYTIAVPAQ